MNATTDMSQVIIPRSDQQNADSFLSGPRTITIANVSISPGTEQPVAIAFDGDDGRPWKPCKSMSRVLVAAWGADANNYIGRSVTLYLDPKVKWGGLAVGGIRISHLSNIDREMVMALTETKGKKSPFVVKPLGAAVEPNPITLTVGSARQSIAGATTLDDLKKIWSAKAMAPFRDELQVVLDERKAALTFEPEAQGVTETVTPETDPAQAKAYEIIAAAAKCEVIADLNNVKDDYANDIEAMPDHLMPLVAGAINGAEKRLRGAK